MIKITNITISRKNIISIMINYLIYLNKAFFIHWSPLHIITILFSRERTKIILSSLSMAVEITFIIHSLEKFLSASQFLTGKSTSATSSHFFTQEVLLAWTSPGRSCHTQAHFSSPSSLARSSIFQLDHEA